jgi:hypothetical protein
MDEKLHLVHYHSSLSVSLSWWIGGLLVCSGPTINPIECYKQAKQQARKIDSSKGKLQHMSVE